MPFTVALPWMIPAAKAAAVALVSWAVLKWGIPAVSGRITWDAIRALLSTAVVEPLKHVFEHVRQAYHSLVDDIANYYTAVYEAVNVAYLALKEKRKAISKHIHTYIEPLISDAFTKISAISTHIHTYIEQLIADAFDQVDAIRKHIHGYLETQIANAFAGLEAVRQYLHRTIDRQIGELFGKYAQLRTYAETLVRVARTEVAGELASLKNALLAYLASQIASVLKEIASLRAELQREMLELAGRVTNFFQSFEKWKEWFDNFQKGYRSLEKEVAVETLEDLYQTQIAGLGWLYQEIGKTYLPLMPLVVKEMKEAFFKHV